MKCWGVNQVTSDTSWSNEAFDMPTLSSGVAQIDVGGHTVCVIMSGSGALKCWGYAWGVLGSGAVKVPTDVPGFDSGVISVSSNDGATCAVKANGKVYCSVGNLSNQPSGLNEVPGILDAVSVTQGSRHACARLQSGAVKCWGNNFSGELGNGRIRTAPEPILMAT